MRQMISGLVAAAAVMFVGAAPAAACGFNPCQPVAPVFSGCNTGCGGYGYGGDYGYGGGYERLAEPTTQYYYVNQGPTYTGPGDWAPRPTYHEDALPGYYRPHRYYRPWHHTGYYHAPRYHYGYATHHAYAPRYAHEPYHYGRHVLRRYY
jgi:hypothetical protein